MNNLQSRMTGNLHQVDDQVDYLRILRIGSHWFRVFEALARVILGCAGWISGVQARPYAFVAPVLPETPRNIEHNAPTARHSKSNAWANAKTDKNPAAIDSSCACSAASGSEFACRERGPLDSWLIRITEQTMMLLPLAGGGGGGHCGQWW